jgi:hypothetical protein
MVGAATLLAMTRYFGPVLPRLPPLHFGIRPFGALPISHSDVGSIFAGGVVGFAAALLGVLVAEWFSRLRARRQQLNEAFLEMESAASIYMVGIPSDRSVTDVIRDYSAFGRAVARARFLARWPIIRKNHVEIARELKEIQIRLYLAFAKMRSDGTSPRFAEILGEQLRKLFGQREDQISEVNAALVANGFPPIEEWDTPTGSTDPATPT